MACNLCLRYRLEEGLQTPSEGPVINYITTRRRVSSVVEHSSANQKVPGSIPGTVSYRVMDYDEACFMHLTPGVVHNFSKAVGV